MTTLSKEEDEKILKSSEDAFENGKFNPKKFLDLVEKEQISDKHLLALLMAGYQRFEHLPKYYEENERVISQFALPYINIVDLTSAEAVKNALGNIANNIENKYDIWGLRTPYPRSF